MGKSKKLSKSHASGLVPNSRTGRIDSKLALSKNSRTLKSLSSNTKDYDNLGVPLEVFSLSKMSRIERKSLEQRLKLELKQVRKLLKKAASANSNLHALSSSSDIRSCSNGQKWSKLASQQRSLEVSSTQAKKRGPLGHDGPKTKGSIESMKYASQVTFSNAMLMKQCQDLLSCLMSRQYAWVFNTPVDIVELEIPDYFSVIKHPMDLGTVKRRITSGQYSSPMDFAADVRLTFSNAMIYNAPDNSVHILAKTLVKYFETRWKAIEKKIPVASSVAPKSSKPTTRVETKISDHLPPLKKKKIRSNDTDVKPEPVRRIMTDDNKHKLSLELGALLEELPTSIINFLKEHSYNTDETNDNEIEIDIDALSEETLVQLQKLLDDYKLEKHKVQEKAEPCEVELPNESLQLCIGNEPVEEDVDIVGGIDDPVFSFPAVAIEKDDATANRNTRCSNSGISSSSSSESGSPSNGSDLSSSSGSESDIAKVLDLKENVGPGLTLDPGKLNQGDSETRKDPMNMIGQVEQSSHSKAVTVGAECCPEGESASERQVFPEELSRAALSGSRFADTILKAKEKALEKDSIHLSAMVSLGERRLFKEGSTKKASHFKLPLIHNCVSLGKAHLHAFSKAAEEAQRKAEAEAAAEAKRKREQEREAAHQALKNMEKTVDFNENCQLLEDLEMLRVVHDEHLPSFTEKASNGLGNFKLQVGCSPLEQLGLYMKLDEDEDENEELSQPTNDVEEGEIV